MRHTSVAVFSIHLLFVNQSVSLFAFKYQRASIYSLSGDTYTAYTLTDLKFHRRLLDFVLR